ncbi:MAG: flagellar basal body P-ring protein FlgI [Rickettsia sp.]|nr:flagellar basal body P-ring protein FlgI [Rickettsia sp.]
MKITILIILLFETVYGIETRIKDIASFEGVRDNILVGYGIVAGLNGTGDNLKNSIFTEKRLSEFLEKLGINLQGSNINTKNIAAVMVTANLPPFSRQGNRIDINVSAIGDSKSLKGGILLATPLLAADGNVYAVAQGSISIHENNEFSQNVKTKNRLIETKGYAQNAAIIEKTSIFDLSKLEILFLSLNFPDFSTAVSVEKAINNNIVGNVAKAIDPGTIKIIVPQSQRNKPIEFISKIEIIKVTTDIKAKIVINESTGTVVIGEKVYIKPVAIAHGNLIINIGAKNYLETMPLNAGEDQIDIVNKNIDLQRGTNVQHFEENSSLEELINGLNKLGVLPRDIINILYNLKMVGALEAIIEVR